MGLVVKTRDWTPLAARHSIEICVDCLFYLTYGEDTLVGLSVEDVLRR
mgnify:FL=1